MKNLEQIIISRCLVNDDELSKVFSQLEVSDFTHYSRQALAMFEGWKEGVGVATKLRLEGFTISEFAGCEDYNTPIGKLCEELQRQNTAKELGDKLSLYGSQVTSKNLEDVAGEAQAALLKSLTKTKTEDVAIESVIQEFNAYQKLYEEKKKSGAKLLGESTGFEKLDDIIDGIREGHLWILGGYTNLGKTYAALNILTNLLKEGKRTVFYSLEMTRVDILARILGILTENNANAIAKGFVDEKVVSQAMAKVAKSKLAILKDKTDISQIILSIHEEVVRNKPALIVVDFLQLVQCKSARSEYEATTTAILELQKAAQRYMVPIIVLSQVSNESVKNGDQQVMGFKGSGGIAAAADLAIELVSGEENVAALREKMRKDESVKIKWHIKKNRHGRVGTILMQFTGKHGIFSDYDNF